METGSHFFQQGFILIPHLGQRFDCPVYRCWARPYFPKRFKLILIEKSRREIRLRVQVHRDDRHHAFRKHPLQVINQGGLPDPAFVVEKSQYGNAHLRLLMVARTVVGST